jgi:ribosome maturation factor RimP
VDRQKELSQRIEEIVSSSLLDLGYYVVCAMVGSQRRVQLLIERADGSSVGIEDCVKASRTASLLLDVADPIQTSYLLEVSSPGKERPLVKWQDYVRFCGSNIAITLAQPIDRQKRFTGVLQETRQDGEEMSICLCVDQGGKEESVWLPLTDILKAHLKEPALANGKRRRVK